MRPGSNILAIANLIVLAVVAVGTTAAAASARVVKLDIARQPLSAQKGPQPWRADIVDGTKFEQALDHNTRDQAYFANLDIGTPPQKVSLLVDTGSVNTWVLDRAARCDKQGGCNTTYNSQDSSTFKLVQGGGFNVSYINNDTAEGDLIRETLGFGGSDAVVVKDLLIGLGKKSQLNTGILGVGYPSSLQTDDNHSPEPRLIDKLKSDGHISARAYSLYLDDVSSTTGSILFGGIDKTKFTGTLKTVNEVPKKDNILEHFRVNLTSITADNSAAGFDPEPLTTGVSSLRVLLDSGTTITRLPPDIVTFIYGKLQVRDDRNKSGFGFVDCNLVERLKGLTIDFKFGIPGDTNAAAIKVPFKEFVIDNIKNETLAGLPQDLGFSRVCWFGLLNGSYPIIGQNVLRSAYVVFDLEHNKIGLAQANVGSGSSSSGDDGEIIEITEKDGIPDGLVGGQSQGGTPTGSGGTSGAPLGPANPTATGKDDGVSLRPDGWIGFTKLMILVMGVSAWML